MSIPGSKNSFLKNLMPFAALVVGAYLGLSQFRKVNYQFKKNDEIAVFKENLQQAGMDTDDYQYKTTEGLQEEYNKTMEKINIDDWKNIR